MTQIVASGQITLMDLNDAKALSAYVTTTAQKSQVYDNYSGNYTPSWATTNITLIPNLFIAGTVTPLIGNAKSVVWDVNGTTITSGTGGYTIAASNTANPFALTIAQNIMTTASPNAKYTATITWTDPTFATDVVIPCDVQFSLVQNGTGGVSSVLSNDAAVVTTANDGTGGTYSTANVTTTASVYVGSTDDSANWTFSAPSLSGCTATISNSNRTAMVTNMTSDTATVTFTATKTGYPTQTLVFSLAKSKTGGAGTSPTAYWLLIDTAALKRPASGVISPGTINITGMSQVGNGAQSSFTSRVKFETTTDGSTWTVSSNAAYNASADTSTWPLAIATSATNIGATVTGIRVTLYASGGTSTLLDQQIIPVVSDAVNNVTGYLTNDSATVATDQSGNSGNYTGTTTDIHVYDGITELAYDGVGTATGTYKVVVGTGVNITAGTVSSKAGTPNCATISAASAMVNTQTSATVTYTISGKNSAGVAFTTFTKTQQFSMAKTGAMATSYWLIVDNKAIKKDASGNYTPATVSLTAKSQAGSGTVANYNGRVKVEYTTDGSTWTTSPTAAYNASADTSTWPLNVPLSDAPANIKQIRYSLYVAGGTTTLLDQEVANVVNDGANSIWASAYAPQGDTVRNNSGSITAECDLYVGATVTTAGATYQWYKYVIGTADQGAGANWLKLAAGSDGGGTTGYTTAVLTIPAGAIASMDTYRCVITYGGNTYTDFITVRDQSDPIFLVLWPDNGGNVFKNGAGADKHITCQVWQAGTQLDTGGTTFTYEWTMYNADGSLNTSWVDYTIANPSALTSGSFADASTGGTIPASTTYYYRYTWVTSYGETQAGASFAHATPASGTSTNKVTITIPALPANVTKANIYVGTVSGSEHLQGSTTGTTYTLSAAPTTTGGTVPASNTASATMKTGKTVTVTQNDVTNIGNLSCSIYQ